MFTYKATNTLNGKFYIGSARDFEKRKKEHLSSRMNYPFQNSLRKNPEIFSWEVVEDDSNEPVLEQALLDMFFGAEMCYNLCPHAGRPQCDPEVAREWGKLNGPIQGKLRHETNTGIFDPSFSEDKREWAAKGGRKTSSLLGKAVRVFQPDGSHRDYASLKRAGRESGLSHSTVKRLLQNGKTSRLGHRVEAV